MVKKFLNLLSLILLINLNIQGQNLDRTITITKTYEAIFPTKDKIDETPEIYDTTKIKPVFNYIILPVKADVEYLPKEIKPARISAIPVEKVYSNFFKIGIGNYFSPVLNYQFSSPRAKDHSYGFNFLHNSSASKIALENNHKIYAGYYDNLIEAYGLKLIDDIKIQGNLFYKGNAINHYGYNYNIYVDSFPNISKSDIRQIYDEVGISFSIERENNDSKLIYSFKPSYSYFDDRFKNNQHNFVINGNISFKWDKKLIDIKTLSEYFYYKTSLEKGKIWFVSLVPTISQKDVNYEYLAGAFIAVNNADSISRFYIVPKANFMIRIAEDYFNPYAGINGYIKSNSYKDLQEINPYIVPGIRSNYSEFLIFYSGIKGLLFSKWGYDIQASYNYKNHIPLFIKDTSNLLQNQFNIVSENLKSTEVSLSTYFYPINNLKFEVGGIYRNIKLEKEKYAWHVPDYEVNTGFSYFIKEKLMTKLNVNYLSSRYAKFVGDTSFYRLPSIVDVNLNIEYFHSKILTFYLNIYNITSTKYEIWYQYPVQKLNFIIGLTYKL